MAISAQLGQDSSLKTSSTGPSTRRKQLHVLYLLNDTLHHARYHSVSINAYHVMVHNLQPHLLKLVKLVSAYETGVHAQHQKRVLRLLNIWAEAGYFEASDVLNLQKAARKATPTTGASAELPESATNVKDQNASEDRKQTPYVMPASHGDFSMPFFDLPAGNMMPHIITNSTNPIDPQLLRPLQFVAGPASQDLVEKVESLLEDVGSLEDQESREQSQQNVYLDDLGQDIIYHTKTTDATKAKGYYGWSENFCDKMKEENSDVLDEANRTAGSDHGSFNPRKRRKNSSTASSNGRSNSGSYYQSRSPSRELYRDIQSRSRSFSPPSPPPKNLKEATATSHSSSTALGRSPSHDPRLPTSLSQQRRPPQPPPFSITPFVQGFPLAPVDFAVPPRPSNYYGPWPPPPPPADPRTPERSGTLWNANSNNQASVALNSGAHNQEQQGPSAGGTTLPHGLSYPIQTPYNGISQHDIGRGSSWRAFGR